jgi:FkbM family methyltransferase
MIKEGLRMIEAEGLRTTCKEFLKTYALYGRPDKILNYWSRRLDKDTVVQQNIQGSLMEFDIKDRGVPRELFLRGIREDKATEVMRTWIRPESVCLEAGSNIGYYALMEARACKFVYAIEPDHSNYITLLNNIRYNHYTNIKAYNCAVGDYNGLAKLERGKSMSWHKIGTSGQDTPIYKIDTMFPDLEVHILRTDTEGYEFRILKGAEGLISRCKPKIFLEVHIDLLKGFGDSLEVLFKFLYKYNYTITHSFIGDRDGPTGEVMSLLKADWGQSVHLFLE